MPSADSAFLPDGKQKMSHCWFSEKGDPSCSMVLAPEILHGEEKTTAEMTEKMVACAGAYRAQNAKIFLERERQRVKKEQGLKEISDEQLADLLNMETKSHSRAAYRREATTLQTPYQFR